LIGNLSELYLDEMALVTKAVTSSSST